MTLFYNQKCPCIEGYTQRIKNNYMYITNIDIKFNMEKIWPITVFEKCKI